MTLQPQGDARVETGKFSAGATWWPCGVVAVDKQGDRILFLDPVSLEIVGTIEDMPVLPHELAISPDRATAFVPAYGDGVHGDNPHPNHLISVIDLATRRRLADIDLRPLAAPHTSRLGTDGMLYICCEEGAAVAVCDPQTRMIVDTIATGSSATHRLAVRSGRGLIFTDNEEDASISVLDRAMRQMVDRIDLPCAIAGIAGAADERAVVVSNAERPELLVIGVDDRAIRNRIMLHGHERPARVARYSPDGRWMIAVGNHEPVVSLFSADEMVPRRIGVGAKPMDGAFHPDGRTLVVANEEDGTLSVINIDEARMVRTVPCGTGCETLGYY